RRPSGEVADDRRLQVHESSHGQSVPQVHIGPVRPGMYLPLELNTPALVGGFLAHYVGKRADRVGGEEGRSMMERGVIIASGLMAGGALGGVFGASLRLFPWYNEELITTPFFTNEPISQTVSAALFVGLCVYLWRGSVKRARP
ncbi:MAG TPA: hypothetical protein VKM72_18305, partial [Thermoanaerobaculia bacterium]|nr:hypothetical protein [Thermoanaerobaculia bacterium]